MKSLTAVCVVCLVALAGCATSGSVLYRGVSFGVSQTRTVITDAAALRAGRTQRAHWIAEIAHAPKNRMSFRNVSAGEFRRRLTSAALHDQFTVVSLQFREAGRVAPLVVLRTNHYGELARAISSIEESVDPHKGREDWQGWAFGAFYLVAQDERGVPFVIVSNVIGLGSAQGSQWARSDALYPFAHG